MIIFWGGRLDDFDYRIGRARHCGKRPTTIAKCLAETKRYFECLVSYISQRVSTEKSMFHRPQTGHNF